MEFPSFSYVQLVILAVAYAALLVQMLYFFLPFLRVRKESTTDHSAEKPVSIIVCARNEEANLRELIPILMEQDYPEFELLVVNDSSWDDTIDTLRAYEVSFPNLRCIHLDDEEQRMSGKKFAMTMGIKGAKHEQLIFTDADCRPASKQWLRHMAAGLNSGKQIALGFGAYRKEKGLLNHLIRYDAFHIGLHYLGLARMGNPYMGIGRNLGYRQDLFLNNGGFKSHMHLNSGDDDLFIHEVGTKHNSTCVIHPEAITVSEPKHSWSDWWNQKRRHLTTGVRYRFGTQLLLALYPLSWLIFMGALVAALVFHTSPLFIIAPFVLRTGVQIAIFRAAGKPLGCGNLAWLAPVSETFVLLFTPVVMLANVIQPPRQWK